MFTQVKLATMPEQVKPARAWQRVSRSGRTRISETRGAGGQLSAAPQPLQPPGADPDARWCGRGLSLGPSMPIHAYFRSCVVQSEVNSIRLVGHDQFPHDAARAQVGKGSL